MKIINLTQHMATPEQVADGVFEPAEKLRVQELLTFTTAPTENRMVDRALELADIANFSGADAAMIGGAPYFMRPLEESLRDVGIRPLYSFTERRVTEGPDPDSGEFRKVSVFKHVGWVGA